MDGLRYGGEAGQSHRVNGAVAGERLVSGDDFNLKLPMKNAMKRYRITRRIFRRSWMSMALMRRSVRVSFITIAKK